ncbi:MAG: hypothetical protein E7174_02105 [Firmicutes bacterium]|nr:hypothetical protein [Bacillota bacterium]
MNESQSLEVKLKSSAEEAVSGFNKLLSTLNLTGSSIQKISTKVDANGNLVNKTLTSVNKKGQKVYTTLYRIGKDGTLQNTTFNMRKLGDATNNTSKMFSKLTSAISLTGLFYGVRKLATTFLTWMTEATDRTEQLNLFNVVFDNMEKNGVKTFSKLGKEAIQFQNKLNYAFGTNLTDTLKYQALFQSMGENASIPKEYASVMSETMTKFTYDLASLYNKKESDVAEALRAGVYAGQTKPLRAYGIDVTQSTMQPLLESLGINDRSVKDLSQGEKEILRYLAALKQAKVAMGDYADTIESPSNQMKIFSNLLVEAKVALTSLFMGTFSKVLPYANAFLLVVREICNVLANLLGIELSDFNSGIASSEDAFVDLDDSISDATDSVKELKRQTLGFDQINNINENKDKNNDYSLNGGIDQRLLDAIYGYDNGMDKVKMKATEIYEKMMGWLGFIKEIDPLTGKVSWKLDNTNSTMGKLLYALKDIVIYGKDAIKGVFEVLKRDFDSGAFGKVLVTIFEKLRDLFKYIASNKKAQTILAKLLETFLLFKTVKTILTPLINVWKTFTTKIKTGANLIQTFGKQLKGTNNYILDSNGNLKEYNKTLEKHKNVVLNADGSVNKWHTNINKAKTALMGIGMSVSGLYMVHDAMKDIASEGPNVTNVLEGIMGSLSTIGGFATIGSIFGPLGTAIGGAIGLLSSFVTAIVGASGTIDKETQNLYNSIETMSEQYKQLEETRRKIISESNSEFSYYEDLYEELTRIVDANGKIKTGYEDRAKFITTTLSNALGIEIDIVNGQVQKYKDLEQSIKDVITQKKAQILLETYEEEYTNAIKTKTEVTNTYNKAVETQKQKQEKYNNALKEAIKVTGKTEKELKNLSKSGLASAISSLGDFSGATADAMGALYYAGQELDEANEKLEKQREIYYKNQKAIETYTTAYELSLDNNLDDLIEYIEKEEELYYASNQEKKRYYMDEINLQKDNLDELEKNKSNYNAEEYQREKLRYENLLMLNQINLTLLVKEVKDINSDMVDAWGKLAQNSEEEFMNKFKLLPQDIQEEIVDKMYAKGYSISEELQKGIDALNINVDIDEENFKYSGKVAGTAWQNSFISAMNKKIQIKQEISTDITSGKKEDKYGYIKINAYANGGFPEDGWFRANHGEIMGKFDNGKSVVANNMQITEGIKQAVMQGMSQVMAQYANHTNQIDVHVHSDEGVVVDRINQTTRQTGVCPINIPY